MSELSAFIWNPGCPFDDTLLTHSEQAGEIWFEFAEILGFGVWCACIFGDSFLVGLIDGDGDKDG